MCSPASLSWIAARAGVDASRGTGSWQGGARAGRDQRACHARWARGPARPEARSLDTLRRGSVVSRGSHALCPGVDVKVRSVQLEVAGQSLQISTDLDDDMLARVREAVNSRLVRIQEAAPGLPPARQALFAALDLAESLVRSEESRTRLERSVLTEADAILALLDGAASDSE